MNQGGRRPLVHQTPPKSFRALLARRAMGECWAQLQAKQPGAVDGSLAAPPTAIGLDAAKGTLIAKFQHVLTFYSLV